ncbi:MAG: single-stranded-DNA-specific exonuclease RecJ, partial [Candidatus Omnitrophica bacterium]|nr:single-stranded-DNA-specific exonuclease RecJ [Candidatus Omnitrophota bacterium]
MSHKILRIARLNHPLQNRLSQELGISPILAQILINRGITTVSDAEQFLHVQPEDMLDPYSFSSMRRAVERIKKAGQHKERVMIYGDYDVDGITAVALLKRMLLKRKIDVLHYLPHRVKEGYGLTKNIAWIAKEMGVRLIITVDCGISNHKEINELKNSGIDVIITDHHEPTGESLPEAFAVINPKAKEARYKFRDLAGVGVAYKLAQALDNNTLLEELDLVALGTIADSVPLAGENRIIAKEGLRRISITKRPGIRVLLQNAGLEGKKVTSTFVNFILGPRINASGRMDTAETSLKLLMSDSFEEASNLAKIVEQHNRQRQKIENSILEEAQAIIDKEINFKEHKVIVLAKENWHQGVLGIVASKLADRFYRPAIVISMVDDLCKGSARSIKNFHLFDALI